MPDIVTTFDVAIDYRMSLEQMVVATDCTHLDRAITSTLFFVEDSRETVRFQLGLFHFNSYLPTWRAVEQIRFHEACGGWKPAMIEHLLCFGKQRPKEQLKHPINALGSVSRHRGRHAVPCLETFNSSRALFLDVCRWERGWEPHYRFLAYRPKKSFLSRLLRLKARVS
ncbi:MAG: hypothetical protein WDN67_05010 [Candidatus Moraniibacteriota bacterium]